MSEQQAPRTVRELRARMDEGLEAFLAGLDRLSAGQLSGPTDAVGWNGRDHVIHLAVWAEGVAALLRRQDRWAAMGLPGFVPGGDELDYDAMNAQIAAQHRHLTPAEARARLVAAHQQLAAAVDALSDADLARPYSHFVSADTGYVGHPIAEYVAGNSYDHYPEHLEFIEQIAGVRS